jgi:hypothetical protein
MEGATRYVRQRTTLAFGTGGTSSPLMTIRASYGSVGGGSDRGLERFVIGGFQSPLIDPLYDARRVEAPAYPAGSASTAAQVPISSISRSGATVWSCANAWGAFRRWAPRT